MGAVRSGAVGLELGLHGDWVSHGDTHGAEAGLCDEDAVILAGVLVAGDNLPSLPVGPAEAVLEHGEGEGVDGAGGQLVRITLRTFQLV